MSRHRTLPGMQQRLLIAGCFSFIKTALDFIGAVLHLVRFHIHYHEAWWRARQVWDFATCKAEATLAAHGGDVKAAAWHPSQARSAPQSHKVKPRGGYQHTRARLSHAAQAIGFGVCMEPAPAEGLTSGLVNLTLI